MVKLNFPVSREIFYVQLITYPVNIIFKYSTSIICLRIESLDIWGTYQKKMLGIWVISVE
jgi:hypothetical protein